MTRPAALQFSDVWKRFGSNQALRGLSLSVPAGSLFGLIGPNGAGKTTTFSIACGFLRPDQGQLTLLDVSGFEPVRLKGRMSAMPQDAALGRETRCLDHLLFFAELQGQDAREARRQAESVLEDVGLYDRRDHKTKTLSHGMLRRLAIAQALLGQPELILLDEPTSGLDPRHAHELRELLRRCSRSRTMTLVISSHNLEELESLCDHVAFIDHGVVVAGGATDALTGKGQQVEIQLATGPVPEAAVAAALPEAQVSWDETTRALRISWQGNSAAAAEDVVAIALRALLDAGARISALRRGTTLEKKFLELT